MLRLNRHASGHHSTDISQHIDALTHWCTHALVLPWHFIVSLCATIGSKRLLVAAADSKCLAVEIESIGRLLPHDVSTSARQGVLSTSYDIGPRAVVPKSTIVVGDSQLTETYMRIDTHSDLQGLGFTMLGMSLRVDMSGPLSTLSLR